MRTSRRIAAATPSPPAKIAAPAYAFGSPIETGDSRSSSAFDHDFGSLRVHTSQADERRAEATADELADVVSIGGRTSAPRNLDNQPLPSGVRQSFERRLGADLRTIRIHADLTPPQ